MVGSFNQSARNSSSMSIITIRFKGFRVIGMIVGHGLLPLSFCCHMIQKVIWHILFLPKKIFFNLSKNLSKNSSQKTCQKIFQKFCPNKNLTKNLSKKYIKKSFKKYVKKFVQKICQKIFKSFKKSDLACDFQANICVQDRGRS